jgi:hypothetical protein
VKTIHVLERRINNLRVLLPSSCQRSANSRGAEGDIVHFILEALFKELAYSGFPALGDRNFQECIARVDIVQSVGKRIEEYEQRALSHPRGGGCRMQKSQQQIANQVIRILRNSYGQIANKNQIPSHQRPMERKAYEPRNGSELTATLKYYGSLSELSLAHSHLPLTGRIDIAWLDKDGVVIADFKTGQKHASHQEQIYCYPFQSNLRKHWLLE